MRLRIEVRNARRGFTDERNAAVGVSPAALLNHLPDELTEGDGDDKPATAAALNTPAAVAAAPNGDIYIADTLNNRIRMVDHITGNIQTVAGDGETGGAGDIERSARCTAG